MFILSFIVSVIAFVAVRPIAGFTKAWNWACTTFMICMIGIFVTSIYKIAHNIITN